MENFISDLSQIEKILRIIPHSPELRNTKVMSAAPPIKVKTLTGLEMMVPHIGRHLEQAERILKGGRLAKEAQVENPDLIFPSREARKSKGQFSWKDQDKNHKKTHKKPAAVGRGVFIELFSDSYITLIQSFPLY